MKIYSRETVLEAALRRLRRLFDEFEQITVCFSGGKDSTVIIELALIVAQERGRLPLRVQFIDQEAEWRRTVEYCRRTAARPELEFRWYQMPLQISNAVSNTSEQEWLQCWDPDHPELWMRDKEPGAVTENVYGTKRFAALFDQIQIIEHGPGSINLTGIRAEEAPTRFMGMSSFQTYKEIAWGSKRAHGAGKMTYTFSPIYDWSYTDVWKFIHQNHIDYNEVYNIQYSHGIELRKMRVSNLHHQTAVSSLFMLQEVERDTYEALTARLQGVKTANKMGESDSFFVKELPFMFSSWIEYRDYLFQHLVKPEHQDVMTRQFKTADDFINKHMATDGNREIIYKACVHAILTNDYHFEKLNKSLTSIYMKDKPATTKNLLGYGKK